MAIDRVTIWRNSPSPEIAFDNELFLEAQQSQFVTKPIPLTATLSKLIKLRITEPSIIVGSIKFSNGGTIKTVKFAADPVLVAGYLVTYAGFDSGATNAEVTKVSSADTVNVDTQRFTIFARISPHASMAYLDVYFWAQDITGPSTVLPGSYIKIL